MRNASFKFYVKLHVRRGLWTLRLGTAICKDAGFNPRILVLAVMLRRGFQPSRLGAALVAIISLASGVWILLLDDLPSVIFRQPTFMFILPLLKILIV